MKLSIVDLSTIKQGETATDALNQSLDTARLADRLGFHRLWFAEHHVTQTQASHHPELLIAAAGTQTRRIRLGSGAVLMNHYSPFKVAEMFKQLEAMYPGRIDLGIGRASAGPVIDMAMRRDRQSRPTDDYAQQVAEAVAWLHNAFPPDHPFAPYPLVATVATTPQGWLLGSSPNSGQLAAQLGLGYSFAAFINPPAAVQALQHYRKTFAANRYGQDKPRAMLGVNVAVGETSEHGARLALSAKGFYARLAGPDPLKVAVPSPEEAERELSEAQREEPTRIVAGRWPRFVAGSADEVRATLEEMVEQSGADEIILQNLIPDPSDRAASHERIARVFELPGIAPAPGTDHSGGA